MFDFNTIGAEKTPLLFVLGLGMLLGVISVAVWHGAKEKIQAFFVFLGTVWTGFWGRVWFVLKSLFSSPYFCGLLFACEVGFQLFLLQQWIFEYNAMYSSENPYNKYAYFPLTLTIPLFFTNIGFGTAIIVRWNQIKK